MILAFQLSDIVTVPFGLLLKFLYEITTNYGVALILFAVIVKLILFPASKKSKISSMKMSRLTPKIQAIQKKYANDQQKQSEAIQALYKEEGVSMGGGCLWSMLPLLVLLPLYAVVRQPIMYMLGETLDVTGQIMNAIKGAFPDLIAANETFYEQMIVAPQLPELAAKIPELKDIVTNPATLEGMNFSFFGINLGEVPQFNVFKWESVNWANIGGFLVPCLSAGSQVLNMLISQKMNNSVITNEKGLEDKEAAKNSQANQSNKMMMWMFPLMSLWFGFTVPGALSLYWFAQGMISILIDVYLTKKYRKVYDIEDAQRLQKAMEEEAAEEEKERIRAERRAANPDGITDNTSKKKLQQKQQREQEAAKAAAAKEYAAKKGAAVEEAPAQAPLSGIADRPYAKGRAYDPNRYRTDHTEE